MQDTFYKVDKLSKEQRIEILNKAYEVNTNSWVDKKEILLSWARIETDMTFEEVMRKFDMSCHFVIIHRRGYLENEYGEVGFSTMTKSTEIDYFLWIYLKLEDLAKIVSDYKLEIL